MRGIQSTRRQGALVFGRLALMAAWLASASPAAWAGILLNTDAGMGTTSPSSSQRDETERSTEASAESYVEVVVPLGGKWFSSALADAGGNLEVGVDGTRGLTRGHGSAVAELLLSDRYQVFPGLPPPPRPAAIEFPVQPGEILWRSQRGLRPAPGVFEGSLEIELDVVLNGIHISVYNFFLNVFSVAGGIEIGPGSSDTALIHLSEVLSGQGDLWGVRTSGFTDVVVLPLLEPDDLLQVRYTMTATGELNGFVDAFIGQSVKFGDPLDGSAGGALVLRFDPGAPGTIPAAGTAWLCLPALAVLWFRRRPSVTRARRRPPQPVGTGPATPPGC